MIWTPTPEWKDQDAIIIGGGTSLSGFDFQQLEGLNTIGCNDAFRLGARIVKICIFGDASWWLRTKFQVDQFTGRVVSCAPTLLELNTDKLLQMRRLRDGLQHGNILGWNYSTGAAAVNLAFSLGATTIYLLGFDMTNNQQKSHWHSHTYRTTNDASFQRFIRGFHTLNQSLKGYPHIKVWNVTDGSSKLPVFDRITVAEFLTRCRAPVSVPAPDCSLEAVNA